MRITHPRSLLPALLLVLALPVISHAQISLGVSVNIEPPELPVYEQPPLPAVGWLWVPGYWAWGDDDYYWVPGTWVEPPSVGVLWTPGYWGFENGAYLFHDGYWGPHVGFYGGVNYGFGYGGVGFEGGEWRGGGFYYNQAVVHIGSDVHVTNVYNKTIINNVTTTRVSYNGGARGVTARPTPAETAAANERHIPRTPAQETHIRAASTNKDLRASVNHGAPAVAATPKPGVFSGKGVVTARPASARQQQSAAEREKAGARPATKPEAKPERAAAERAKPEPAAKPERAATQHPQANESHPAPAASHEGVAHPAARQNPPTPRPEAKPAAERPAPRPEAKPAAAAPRPEPKPAAERPAPRPEAKPAAAAPRPEPKPAPEPRKPPEKPPE